MIETKDSCLYSNLLCKFISIVLITLFTSFCCISQDYSTEIVEKIYTISDGLPSNEVHYIYEDDENYLWFCTDEGLSRFDGANFKNYDKKDGLPEVFVLKLKKLNSGKTIGWTLHGFLFYFENGKINNISINGNLCLGHDKCIITDIVDDQFGNLYVSNSDRYGYLIIDSNGNVERKDFNKGEGLTYKTIEVNSDRFSYFSLNDTISKSAILLSKLDSILDVDISRYGVSRPIEINGNFYQIIDDKLLVINNDKWSVIELPESCWSLSLRKNNIMLFSHFYGYFEYSIKDKKLISKSKKYQQYSLTNFYQDSRGTEWITTHSSGVIRKSPNTIKEVKLDFLDGRYIYNSKKSKDGHIFILADENEFKKASLWKLSPDFEVNKVDENVEVRILFQSIDEENNVIYFNQTNHLGTYSFNAFRKNTLYVNDFLGCLNDFISDNTEVSLSQKMVYKDLCLYTISRNILTISSIDQMKKKRIEIDRKLDIRSISASQKHVFLGTKNNGLYSVNIESGKVDRYKEKLSSNHIKSITIQSVDTLYISTIKGIHRLVKKNDSYEEKGFVNENIGLPIQEINEIHYQNDSLLITYPNSIFLIPVTTFDEIDRLKSKPFISAIKGYKGIAEDSILNIKYKNNNISFIFSQLSFGDPAKDEVWYRLLGNNEGWTLSETDNLEYISLPPKDYTFQIATKDQINDELVVCDQFLFTVETPFYLSIWMYIIYGIAGLLLLTFLIFIARRYDRIKQDRIFSLKSLRLKVLMSQLNPHFIFNVLNGIQSLIVDNNQVEASDKLADFSRLLRNTLDASDRSLITIKEDLELIKEYSNFEIIRKNGAIDVIFNIDSSLENFYVPPLLIQPLVENSIRHGLKNEEGEKGKIEIVVKNCDAHIYFLVKDNGSGINKNAKSKYGKGIQLVKERIKIINEKNNVDDEFTIESNTQGTSISFNLSKIVKPWT